MNSTVKVVVFVDTTTVVSPTCILWKRRREQDGAKKAVTDKSMLALLRSLALDESTPRQVRQQVEQLLLPALSFALCHVEPEQIAAIVQGQVMHLLACDEVRDFFKAMGGAVDKLDGGAFEVIAAACIAEADMSTSMVTFPDVTATQEDFNKVIIAVDADVQAMGGHNSKCLVIPRQRVGLQSGLAVGVVDCLQQLHTVTVYFQPRQMVHFFSVLAACRGNDHTPDVPSFGAVLCDTLVGLYLAYLVNLAVQATSKGESVATTVTMALTGECSSTYASPHFSRPVSIDYICPRGQAIAETPFFQWQLQNFSTTSAAAAAIRNQAHLVIVFLERQLLQDSHAIACRSYLESPDGRQHLRDIVDVLIARFFSGCFDLGRLRHQLSSSATVAAATVASFAIDFRPLQVDKYKLHVQGNSFLITQCAQSLGEMYARVLLEGFAAGFFQPRQRQRPQWWHQWKMRLRMEFFSQQLLQQQPPYPQPLSQQQRQLALQQQQQRRPPCIGRVRAMGVHTQVSHLIQMVARGEALPDPQAVPAPTSAAGHSRGGGSSSSSSNNNSGTGLQKLSHSRLQRCRGAVNTNCLPIVRAAADAAEDVVAGGSNVHHLLFRAKKLSAAADTAIANCVAQELVSAEPSFVARMVAAQLCQPQATKAYTHKCALWRITGGPFRPPPDPVVKHRRRRQEASRRSRKGHVEHGPVQQSQRLFSSDPRQFILKTLSPLMGYEIDSELWDSTRKLCRAAQQDDLCSLEPILRSIVGACANEYRMAEKPMSAQLLSFEKKVVQGSANVYNWHLAGEIAVLAKSHCGEIVGRAVLRRRALSIESE
jgi:hypothetical protein